MEKQVTLNVINNSKEVTEELKMKIANFLFIHLEQYGDPLEDIMKAINYTLSSTTFGGNIITARVENKLCGAVVLNNTGMKGYIPENILVYIAVSKDYRGMGKGKQLMAKSMEVSDGNIALHVEEDNPAKFLYEKIGFKKKYAEMRYIRS